MISIEPCSLGQLDLLRSVSIDTFIDTFREQNAEENLQAYVDRAFDEEQLERELTDSESAFYLIYLDGQLAGYLKLNWGDGQTEKMGNDHLEVERIYVRTIFKRKGLGRRLLRHAFDEAKNKGKEVIWLGVWEENQDALQFYKKLGFSQAGEHVFLFGEEEQTDLILKRLVEI
ncbi:GNAT family N-acetyltransferase [Listeria aquatica]|uniref:GNAT family N-acetyltransferase n=1 Tax=Listeria aquatica TaxID=1494960 RepID=A0A841ZQ94_9LIST|nr:GNAT family N-acetyltransferase [Listeria aquatica]MBC1521697.1 GNAT family N-acetyltransferase [Listeria aquatica]